MRGILFLCCPFFPGPRDVGDQTYLHFFSTALKLQVAGVGRYEAVEFLCGPGTRFLRTMDGLVTWTLISAWLEMDDEWLRGGRKVQAIVMKEGS